MNKNFDLLLTKFQKTGNRFFPLPKDFFKDFKLLFFTPNIKGILDFLQKEHKGRFRKGKDDVSDRILKHWENEGIIPANRKTERGWRAYGFIDHLWTEIVIELRKFGYSLSNIKQIRESYLTAFHDTVAFPYPLLALYFIYGQVSKDLIYLLVFDDGRCELVLRKDYISGLAKHDISSDEELANHITIDITSIINRLEYDLQHFNPLKHGSLSPGEEKIIDSYRQKYHTEITITRSGNREIIETQRQIDLSKETLNSSLYKTEFGTIEAEKVKGKIIRAKLTKKEEL